METVCALVNSHEYRQALVRLWWLSQQKHDGGGYAIDHWAQLKQNDVASKAIANFSAFGMHLLTPAIIQQRPTDLVSALDTILSQDKKKPSLPLAIRGNGASYFLVPCRQHQGFEQQQPVRFANYMRHHHVVPEKLTDTVTTVIRDLTGFPFMREHFQALLDCASPTLTVGLGLFPDRHALVWSRTSIDASREIAYATGTDGDEARQELAQQQIADAEELGAAILVFPELTLSPNTQRKIADWLLRRCREDNACTIPLIILGSFHCEDGLYRRNRAQILWGRDGTVIARHDKYSPATLASHHGQPPSTENGATTPGCVPTRLTEDFVPGQSALLLHTPIGNLSLGICKDCFDDYQNIWLKHLHPEWLLIPSLSDSLGPHLAATGALWKRHRCVSIVANQPSSPEKIAQAACDESPHFGYIELGKVR